MPKPTITDATDPATVATSATFGFIGLTAAFDCSLDGATFRRCASPVTYSGLELGAHTFRVRGRDPTGDTGDSASYTWKIVKAKAVPAAAAVPRPLMITVPRETVALTDGHIRLGQAWCAVLPVRARPLEMGERAARRGRTRA